MSRTLNSKVPIMRRFVNHRWPWLLTIIPVGLLTGAFHDQLVAIAWPLPGVIIVGTSIVLALAVTPRPRARLSLALAVTPMSRARLPER